MTPKEFIQQLQTNPNSLDFEDTINVIEQHFNYTPTKFNNAQVINEAGTNEGSCKIFAFGKLMQLAPQETLNCFGRFYREDVLKHPTGEDHANIRQFIKTGWEGISFDTEALSEK